MLSHDVAEPEVAIGLPVRNEVRRLPRLLTALAEQHGSQPFRLCIFFDNCTDGSPDLVAGLASQLPFAIDSERCAVGGPPNAGAARRRALALASAYRGSHAAALLTTDADSEPAPDWIAANLIALEKADVIAGRIFRKAGEAADMQHRVASYYDRLHVLRRRIDPVPWEDAESHHWTSGASLAFRAGVYRQVGGFPPIPNGEDAAFADVATRAGFRVRRDPSVIVRTSSRRKGRAEEGFAATLSMLDALPEPPQVSHPDDETWRFRFQADARAAFEAGHPGTLAEALMLPLSEVEAVARECHNGEAFAARIVGTPAGGMRMVSLAHAEALLVVKEQSLLVGAA